MKLSVLFGYAESSGGVCFQAALDAFIWLDYDTTFLGAINANEDGYVCKKLRPHQS